MPSLVQPLVDLGADCNRMQTFWLYQTYLHDLSGNPQSASFKTCRRIYNRVQRIVFGASEPARKEKIKENVLPVMVLSGIILAGVAAPFLPRHAGPLVVAQARKPRPTEELISDAGQMQKLGRSNTVVGGSTRPRRHKARPGGHSDTDERTPVKSPVTRPNAAPRQPSRQSIRARSGAQRPSLLELRDSHAKLSSSSLPDSRGPREPHIPTPSPSASLALRAPELARRHSHASRLLTPSALSHAQKVRMLRSNYLRNETQFLAALEDISNRLVVVPKPARLSALRAELALIDRDLPAEVDIPVICPAVLEDGSAGRSRHHRIVRLNPAEATSLNSAERVPYLLMVEVLREDFDFDPASEANEALLNELLFEKDITRRHLFDISDASRETSQGRPPEPGSDSVFEPATGDLGSPALLKGGVEDTPNRHTRPSMIAAGSANKIQPPRSSSGANTMSSGTILSTPRTSDMENSRSNSPAPRKMVVPIHRTQAADQPDFSALATHMRTAAQMLTQLDNSGSKRPKAEVAAIKAKIIASMQSLEEQSFYVDDTTNTPTFDSIIANANAVVATAEPVGFEDGLEAAPDPGLSSGAGAARMENDEKTGGVQRKGDRDDPSAATFGEEWTVKKERIRHSSPYGWMKSWDLVSVIVKTGADLRQEAFACQLIQVCDKIWQDAGVPVWVKRMRILVTGESSGLIETITNGVSLHSLKRSLTLASIAAGTNPRKSIATLRDHFIRTFGEPDSDTCAAGVSAFTRSLAAYSIICYVLQLKDRHNGNILIDNVGHIVHIDFGFMLSNSPGSMGFEAAPFKLTQEYIDVLGGFGSPAFGEFKALCKQAFQALRKEAEKIVTLVEMMGRESKMPCFAAGVTQTTSTLRARFMLQLSKEEAGTFVEELVSKSVGSYYTRL